MPKNKLEYLLLTAALMYEGKREKIFNQLKEEYFSISDTAELFSKFKAIWEKYPSANMAAFLEVANEDSKKMIVLVASEVFENQIDDNLRLFVELANSRIFRKQIEDVAFAENVTPADIREIAERAEQVTAKPENANDNYLNTYFNKFETIPTGFDELDHLLNGGLLEGTVASIGARPSVGKTTFAINIASHNPDKQILFFSLEMSAKMILDRLVADVGNIDYTIAGKHEVSSEQFKKVKEIVEMHRNMQVFDRLSNISDIVQLIYQAKPDMAIIDFAQIITTDKQFIDNRQRIDYISQKLKQCAKATGTVVLLLSQLTRDGREQPTMSNLKESGGLEQDSDYIILLHRPYVLDKTNEDVLPKDATVILDKNKFGNTNKIKFDFNGAYQRFTECDTTLSSQKLPQGQRKEDLPFDL